MYTGFLSLFVGPIFAPDDQNEALTHPRSVSSDDCLQQFFELEFESDDWKMRNIVLLEV